MRISTSMIYDLGVNRLQQQSSDLITLQQQIAAGRRILAPSDDPIASARVLEVSQSISLNKQYDTNMGSVTSALGLADITLNSVGNLIQDVRTMAVNAGNGSFTDQERASLAAELRGLYQDLLGLANSTDGNGQHLFSGYKGNATPFTETTPGNVVYSGDQGQRLIQISTSRQIAVSDSGADIFLKGMNGNGTFVTAASAANTGSGVISPGSALDLSKWNSAANNKDYRIVFAVDNSGASPVTTYDIIDSTNNSIITGAASEALASATGGARFPRIYNSGSDISFKQLDTDPGMPGYAATGQPAGFATVAAWDYGSAVTISGDPASSQAVGVYNPATPGIDSFTVKASTNTNIFTTINDLITLLKTPTVGSAGNTQLINGLNTALSDLDGSLNNLLTVRASVGARMRENDAVQSTGADLQLQYQQTTSALQDLDVVKAYTDLTRQQTALQASQQSFMKVQSLSLFNYM